MNFIVTSDALASSSALSLIIFY